MKTILSILLTVSLYFNVYSQAPNRISYQGVVRDNTNTLVSNTNISIRLSILKTSASGTSVFTELHNLTTNDNGLFSLQIGNGAIVSGSFNTIDWSIDTYFVKTEIDLSGGTSYTIVGVSQMLSVPYALHSKNTDSWSVNGNTTYTKKFVGIGTSIVDPSYNVHIKPESSIGGIFVEQTIPGSGGGVDLKGYNGIKWGIRARPNSGLNPSGLSLINLTSDISVLDIDSSNNINLGVNSSGIKVNVKNVIRLIPLNTSPTSPVEGDMYMNGVTHKLMVYDGTTWQPCW